MTNHLLSTLTLGALASITATPALADPTPATPAANPTSIYRLDISITGLDTQPATYTMALEENQDGSMQTGANIPIGAGSNATTRTDVGLKLRFKYKTRGTSLVLDGDVEMSAVDGTGSGGPSIHRVRASGVAALTPGTQAMFASVFDVQSHKRYEIDVTAKKVL